MNPRMNPKRPIYLCNPELGQHVDRDKDYLPCDLGRFFLPYPHETMKRCVGVEIEVEGCGNELDWPVGLANGWTVEKDPSLRGPGAKEFILQHPSSLARGIHRVRSFFKHVEQYREEEPGTFVFSERTSIHVHVDVRALTWLEVLSVARLYLVFEKSLFDLVGRQRYHNIFCTPLSATLACNGEEDGFRVDKYCALNLKTTGTIGTVEFRGMAGTDDHESIVRWMTMCASLVEFCFQNSPDKVRSMINTLKTESQYQMLADSIWGNVFGRALTMFPESSDDNATLARLI